MSNKYKTTEKETIQIYEYSYTDIIDDIFLLAEDIEGFNLSFVQSVKNQLLKLEYITGTQYNVLVDIYNQISKIWNKKYGEVNEHTYF